MTAVLRSLPGIVAVATFFALWEIYCRTSGISPLLLPPPTRVGAVFFEVALDPTTLGHAEITLFETLAGFVLATLFGIAMGWGHRHVAPDGARAPPLHRGEPGDTEGGARAALCPVVRVGPTSKIIVAAVIAFFPVMVNTMLGLRSVQSGHADVFAALRATTLQRILLLQIPSALPAILAGMEMAIVLATIGAVVGEYLGGSEGLGYLAVATMNAFQTDRLFVLIILLTLMGFVLYMAMAALRGPAHWLARRRQRRAL